MPTVLRVGAFRFFFYAGDGSEPAHVHVERDDCEAKFWLDPVLLERSHGFSRKDINRIRQIIEDNQQAVGMPSSTSDRQEVLARDVSVTDEDLAVDAERKRIAETRPAALKCCTRV